jgi:hypothetical protein
LLDSPEQLLIVLDAGYSRMPNSTKGIDFAADAIAQITHEMTQQEKTLLRVVYMGSSFPNTSHEGVIHLPSLDWTAWQNVQEEFPCMFGDYAATYRHPIAATKPHGWRAQVVMPLNEGWITYRDVNAQDRQGWIDGAKEIVGIAEFNENTPKTWGVDAIRRAAKGDLTNLDWPRDWYGVKVNIHLHRQIHYAPGVMEFFSGGGEDE